MTKGARIYPNLELDWKDWSLLELLESCGVTPKHPELRTSDEYVNKVAGWINRLNEVRSHLGCSVCGQVMIPNYTYALNLLSAYRVTVFSCQQQGHDQNIYLSHCWACEGFIDSRESHLRVEAYYLCLRCGSGPQRSEFYRQGDICPKCGAFELSETRTRIFKCEKCGHSIYLPPTHKLTGNENNRSIRIEFLQKNLIQ